MRRRCWPSGGAGLGGLTMSEDGGLHEVEESFLAAASCSWRRATVPSSTFNAPLGVQLRLQADSTLFIE